MDTISISRRRFAQLLGAGAAGTFSSPVFTFAREPVTTLAAAKIVRLSSNENPYGPSVKALKAITEAFDLACRYPDDHADLLVVALAKKDGVNAEQILLGAGSGEILKICAVAFTGRGDPSGGGKLVVADPTFEAIIGHASRNGAEVVKIPLTERFSHDLAQMGAAAKGGLVYICNPNNPTASITPKKEIADFIKSTPPETMILVDEAYHHYVESPDYESVIPLLKDHPNLIVARTFSKIYGMAGMRCGYAIGQAETIKRMRPHQLNDGVSIAALVAATKSIDDANQVANGRRLNTEARTFVLRELDRMGYAHVPSQANFIMVDVKRSVVPLIAAMKERNVQIGRLFPAMPNHMRVTIGKREEMEAFMRAFREVLA